MWLGQEEDRVLITSRSNARIRLARKLHRRRGRETTGLWLVEGVRPLEEALRHGAAVDTLFVTAKALKDSRVAALAAAAEATGATKCEVSEELLVEVSDAQTPQGVVGIVLAPTRSADILLQPDPWVLVVDRVQDPGNLGTLFRTALAASVTGVVLVHGTVDPGNPKAVRASAGAVFGLNMAQYTAEELLSQAERAGVRLAVADLAGHKSIYDMDWTGPTALVVGNEAAGPSELLKEAAADLVRIPMPGPVESLNVSIAAALCLFEGVRQRLYA